MAPHKTSHRLHSIDFLRGLIMIFMLVDHVRYIFFPMTIPTPMVLEDTDVAVFFTRWITHFCAPVFVFLTGLSAYLHASRYEISRTELSVFLVKRGLLLIALEVTLINFVWTFDPTSKEIILQVIWAIGASMICLAGLIWLPRMALCIVAWTLIAGHNLLDTLPISEGEGSQILWSILHYRSEIPLGGGFTLNVVYPILPWIGLMALGFVFGKWFRKEETSDEQRRRLLLQIGIGFTVGFILLRVWNGYGDANPWMVYEDQPVMTFMAFLNLNKYPPSLLYILMTIGPALLVLRAAEGWRGKWHDVVVTVGRVPFFFYVLHWYTLYSIYRITSLAMGYHMDGSPASPDISGKLGVSSIVWIWIMVPIALAILYPLIARFARLKAEKRSMILSYF